MSCSYAQRQVPYPRRKPRPGTNISRWRTDCPNCPSCLLLIFPYGELLTSQTRFVLQPNFRFAGHTKAHGTYLLRGGAGAFGLHIRGLHGACSETRTCYARHTKSWIAALYGEGTNSRHRRKWI